jgi:DNA-binding NarL/FixJ family response regulator/EAL domain-containing protein (putative c-di-GMP-specific phosphodiesterase class I)
VTPHTVVIADDDREFRSALADVVERAPSLTLVGAARDAAEAIALGTQEHPSVAIVDVRMDGGGGPRVAADLKRLAPDTRVLALSAYDDRGTVLEMIEAGATGYVLKGASASELVDAIERTAAGGTVLSADLGMAREQVQEPVGPDHPLRVILADDNPEFLDALTLVIERQPDFELVGKTRDTQGVIRLAAIYRPDVALVDWRMPGGGGAVATAEILRISPRTRVLALSATHERKSVLEMLSAGATSYIVKSVTEGELVEIVRTTAAGSAVLSPEAATNIVEELVVRVREDNALEEVEAEKVAAVRSVIDDGKFEIAFQPIMSLNGAGLVGVEALARFDGRPRRSPDVWFDEAVAAGLGTELDMAAAEKALTVLPHLPPDVPLFLNVRPESLFSDRFAELMESARGESVVVELTEHAPVHDYSRLQTAVAHLRNAGIRVAVDDIGAGYASLRHLLNLRPDMIKLDISLCRFIERDRARQVLAEGLVALARELGATVIAEGIETSAELEAVRKIGVDSVQGYFLGRPTTPPLDHLFTGAAPALCVGGRSS